MYEVAALLEAIVALTAALLWPTVVVVDLWMFRGEIRDLIGRLRRGVIMAKNSNSTSSIGPQRRPNRMSRPCLAASRKSRYRERTTTKT
jgi:hypothetical protein